MGDDRVGGISAVSLKADDQVEESLIRIRFPLFAHIVGRRFVEMQPANGNLRHLILLQFHPESIKTSLDLILRV